MLRAGGGLETGGGGEAACMAESKMTRLSSVGLIRDETKGHPSAEVLGTVHASPVAVYCPQVEGASKPAEQQLSLLQHAEHIVDKNRTTGHQYRCQGAG